MEQLIQISLVVEHQPKVDFSLRFEVLVDGAFADANPVGDHLDSDAVFTLFEEQLERRIENLLFATAKFADLAGFILHKRLRSEKSKQMIMPV